MNYKSKRLAFDGFYYIQKTPISIDQNKTKDVWFICDIKGYEHGQFYNEVAAFDAYNKLKFKELRK